MRNHSMKVNGNDISGHFYIYIVKRKIIGEDLFAEIGELINFAKISSHQMNKIWTPPTFFQ